MLYFPRAMAQFQPETKGEIVKSIWMTVVVISLAGCATSTYVSRDPAADEKIDVQVAQQQSELNAAFDQIEAQPLPDIAEWEFIDKIRGKHYLCFYPNRKAFAVTIGDSIYSRRNRRFLNLDALKCKEIPQDQYQRLMKPPTKR